MSKFLHDSFIDFHFYWQRTCLNMIIVINWVFFEHFFLWYILVCQSNDGGPIIVRFIVLLRNFLVACTRLYKSLCRSIGPWVGPSIHWSVHPVFFGVLRPVSDFDLRHCPCQPHVTDAVVYTAVLSIHFNGSIFQSFNQPINLPSFSFSISPISISLWYHQISPKFLNLLPEMKVSRNLNHYPWSL